MCGELKPRRAQGCPAQPRSGSALARQRPGYVWPLPRSATWLLAVDGEKRSPLLLPPLGVVYVGRVVGRHDPVQKGGLSRGYGS